MAFFNKKSPVFKASKISIVYSSVKNPTIKQVEEISVLAKKHGFKIGGFRSFGKAVTSEEIKEIKLRATGVRLIPALAK